MNEAAKRELALSFVAAVKTGDRELLRSITTEDVVWSMAGDNVVSGEASGLDAILDRANTLRAFEVNVRLEHIAFVFGDVVLIMHITGAKNGMVFDTYLTTIMILRDGKIDQLNNLRHDVPMMNIYFKSYFV